MNLIIFWAVLVVVFVVVELMTSCLTSIWFALGAAGALVSAAVAPELFWFQLLIFIAISAITLYFTRPLVKKYVKVKETATNADRVLEMIGVVKEEVSNVAGSGTVYVGGKLWTARTKSENEVIPVGAQVDILQITGAKLIVRPHVTEKVETSET